MKSLLLTSLIAPLLLLGCAEEQKENNGTIIQEAKPVNAADTLIAQLGENDRFDRATVMLLENANTFIEILSSSTKEQQKLASLRALWQLFPRIAQTDGGWGDRTVDACIAHLNSSPPIALESERVLARAMALKKTKPAALRKLLTWAGEQPDAQARIFGIVQKGGTSIPTELRQLAVTLSTHEQPSISCEALAILEKSDLTTLSETATAELKASLFDAQSSEKPCVRGLAISTMAALPNPPSEYPALLTERLKDAAPFVRSKACGAASRTDSTEQKPELAKLTEDTSKDEIRLSLAGPNGSARHLVYSASPDGQVRSAAILALQHMSRGSLTLSTESSLEDQANQAKLWAIRE